MSLLKTRHLGLETEHLQQGGLSIPFDGILFRLRRDKLEEFMDVWMDKWIKPVVATPQNAE